MCSDMQIFHKNPGTYYSYVGNIPFFYEYLVPMSRWVSCAPSPLSRHFQTPTASSPFGSSKLSFSGLLAPSKTLTRKAVNSFPSMVPYMGPIAHIGSVLVPYLFGILTSDGLWRWFWKLFSRSKKLAYQWDRHLSCWWGMPTQLLDPFLQDIHFRTHEMCTTVWDEWPPKSAKIHRFLWPTYQKAY